MKYYNICGSSFSKVFERGFIMENLVEVQNNQVITTSRKVAESFKKQHKDVLEVIRGILAAENSAAKFYCQTTFTNRGKQYPEYYMNRDGFSLLVMGFTGQKAIEWKIKYIEAFNRMEDLLKKRENNKEYIAKIIDRFFLPELNPSNNQELMTIKIKQLNELRGILPYIKDLDKRNVLAEYLTRELIRIDLWDAYRMTDPTDWSINTPEGANKWGVLINSLNLIGNNRPVTREELRKLAQEIREICEGAENKVPPKRSLPRQARGKKV